MECTVCEDVSQDTRLLPCLHNACENCLKDLIDESLHQKKPLACVECQQPFERQDVVYFHANVPVPFCSAHEAIAGSVLFCRDCDELVCVQCNQSHSSIHALLDLNVAKTQVAESFAELTSKLQERVKQITEARSRVAKLHTEVYHKLQRLIQTIDQSFALLMESKQETRAARVAQLQARHDYLVKIVCETTAVRIKETELQLDELKMDADATTMACDRAYAALAGPVVDFLQLKKTLVHRLSTLLHKEFSQEPRVRNSLNFIMPALPTYNLSQLMPVDKIGYCGDLPVYSQPSTAVLVRSEHLLLPTGLALLPDGNIIVCNSQRSQLVILTPTFKMVRAMELNTDAVTHKVAVSPLTGQLLVSDIDSNSIKVLSPQGSYIKRIQCVRPNGIIARADGSIVVSSGNSIRAFSARGAELWLSFADGSLKMVKDLLELPNGDIAIADDSDHIQVISSSGAFVRYLYKNQVKGVKALALTPEINPQLLVASSSNNDSSIVACALDGSGPLQELHQEHGRNSSINSIVVLLDGRIVFSQARTNLLVILS